MNDVSGNNEQIEEDQEEYEETFESTGDPYYAADYSDYFENLQSIGIILISVLIGCTISICFFKGLSK